MVSSIELMPRGSVVLTDLDPVVGHEQGRVRPCVVMQTQLEVRYSTLRIVVPLTSTDFPVRSPAYVRVYQGEAGLPRDSWVLCDQIRAIDKARVIRSLGLLPPLRLGHIEYALARLLGLVRHSIST